MLRCGWAGATRSWRPAGSSDAITAAPTSRESVPQVLKRLRRTERVLELLQQLPASAQRSLAAAQFRDDLPCGLL